MAFWFIDSYAELSSTGNAVRHTEEPPTTHVEENAGQVRLESFKCDALTNSVAKVGGRVLLLEMEPPGAPEKAFPQGWSPRLACPLVRKLMLLPVSPGDIQPQSIMPLLDSNLMKCKP